MQVLWFLIGAVASGIVAGMGMGGGTLLIPVLTIFFHIKQQVAQGINLLAFIPTAIVALIIHTKNKLVKFRIGIPIILSGVCASIGGSLLATTISSKLLKILFGAFLLIVGLVQIITLIIDICKHQKTAKKQYKKKVRIVLYKGE